MILIVSLDIHGWFAIWGEKPTPFLAASLTAPLKYCQLQKSSPEMAVNLLRNVAGVCCSNIGILQTETCPAEFWVSRMICLQIDPELGSDQSVVSFT